jgi:hypothetical protein
VAGEVVMAADEAAVVAVVAVVHNHSHSSARNKLRQSESLKSARSRQAIRQNVLPTVNLNACPG